MKFIHLIITLAVIFISSNLSAQFQSKLVPVEKGWSKNSINTVVFRKSALTTHGSTQFISFYDSLGRVVIGKRTIGSNIWETKVTKFTGNVKDAHNSISIMSDGEGYLHLSWDHHNTPLNYTISKEPLSLDMHEPTDMMAKDEISVSYPEFHRLPNGDLLFFYRNGESGKGNLIINKYDIKNKNWERLHSNLIDGEGKRNAYWQCFIDKKGAIHLSWVWRETWDVATNHDMCYAVSKDNGLTWEKSNGEKYRLPINAGSAEIAWKIPQNSELINQTSMYADQKSNPYIVTYWKNDTAGVPQFQLIYSNKNKWRRQTITKRKTDFSLSGGGTKAIPISRPQVVVNGKKAMVIYRDVEYDNKVCVSVTKNLKKNVWHTYTATNFPVDSWEPSYDNEQWKANKSLHLFVQRTSQGDGENLTNMPSQMVYVLEIIPDN